MSSWRSWRRFRRRSAAASRERRRTPTASDTSVRTGRRGEAAAAQHLARQGYRILDANWRSGRFELDLVVRYETTVAFVEVKTRRTGVQPAIEGLSRAQRRRLRRAAEAWIHAHPGVGDEFRFDLVAVEIDPVGTQRIEHVPDAFYGDDCF